MKKIFALLLVIFISFTTFVSAQDTLTEIKAVTFLTDTVTLVRGEFSTDKIGHFELTFSKEPGIIFFRDLDSLTLMKITLGEQILTKTIRVCYNNVLVPATAMTSNAYVSGMPVIFSTVLLNDDWKTIYAFGITLDTYSILIKVIKY